MRRSTATILAVGVPTRGTAPADDVRDTAERRGCGMRRDGRQPADPRYAGRAGPIREHDVARRAGLERAAGHDELPGRRGDGRIAERKRQTRDDARRDTGSPGDDRVQPARSRVAADHVRGAADHRCRLVGARRGQASDDRSRTSSDRDTDDPVALRTRGRSPAEHVDEAAYPHRRRVVNRRRQPSCRAVSTRRGDPDIGARGVRRGQAAEKHRAVSERHRRGVLHRGGQSPRFPLDEHVVGDADAFRVARCPVLVPVAVVLRAVVPPRVQFTIAATATTATTAHESAISGTRRRRGGGAGESGPVGRQSGARASSR